MPLARVRRGSPNREKPTEIVRRLDSRLPWAWDGLCFAVPFNDPTRDAARDIVSNIAPSTVVGLQWARDNRGNPVARLDNSSYLEYVDHPMQRKPDTALTVYARLRRNGSGEGAGSGIFIKEYDLSDPWETWGIYQSGTVTHAFAYQILVGAPPYIYGENNDYVPGTTEWVSVFMRWASGGPPVVDVLGERGQILTSITNATTGTGSLLYASNKPIKINAAEPVSLNYNADYSQVMLWSRRLSTVEQQSLVADPYGWYSPRRETVVLSGGPYLLAAQQVINGTATAIPAQGGN